MSATTNQMMRPHIHRKVPHRHQCQKAILTMCKRFSTYYCLEYLKESSDYLHAEDVSVRNLHKCADCHETLRGSRNANIHYCTQHQKISESHLVPDKTSPHSQAPRTKSILMLRLYRLFFVEVVFSLQAFFLILLGI
jgi:hypothetical protein